MRQRFSFLLRSLAHLHLNGRRRVLASAALILVAYWSIIVWVSIVTLTTMRNGLERDAERVNEYVTNSLNHSLDLAAAIFDTIDLAYAQIPDPYTVSIIVGPAATSALNQLDAVVLNINGTENALAVVPVGWALPSCNDQTGQGRTGSGPGKDTPSPPNAPKYSHYDLSPAGLLATYRLTARWNSDASICIKIGAERLRALFAVAIGDDLLRVRLISNAGVYIDSARTGNTPTVERGPSTSADDPAILSSQRLIGMPLKVEVLAQEGAALTQAHDRLTPLWIVSLFISAVIIVGALRVMQYITALEQAATRDGLTGLFNRRHFYERANAELSRRQRDPKPLALVLVDVDHFKQINDTYGHAVGDEVLRAIAQRLREASRSSDLVGRYGGEEFILLLSPADSAAAALIAERLRSSIAALPVATERGPLAVTLSAGLCISPAQDTPSLESLAKRADTALYQAKAAGRNRVCVAVESADATT